MAVLWDRLFWLCDVNCLFRRALTLVVESCGTVKTEDGQYDSGLIYWLKCQVCKGFQISG